MSVKYVNGLLSASSDRILTNEELNNLSLLSRESFIKRLSELDFGPRFTHVKTIEEIISYETNKLNELLLPYREFDNLRIIVFYDHLLSSLLSLYKHKVFNLSLNEITNELIEVKVLKEAVLNNLVSRVEPFYRDLIELINISIKNIEALDDLNNLIVKTSYEFLYDYLLKQKENQLVSFLKYKIDLLNLNFAIQINNYSEINNKTIIERGDLFKVVLKSKNFDDLLNNQMQSYDVLLKRRIQKLLNEESLYLIPEITNLFLMEKIRDFKYDLISQNHILYYVLSSLEQFKVFKEIYFGVYDGR